MAVPKILAFAGSLRRGSYNKMLVRIAAGGARSAGAEVTELDLRDYPVPVYDADLEAQGIPANVQALKEMFLRHTGLLIASPEYNTAMAGAFKNVIDWISRRRPNEKPLAAFDGKVAAIMSASTTAFGGVRGLLQVRTMLGNMKVLVLPDQVMVPLAAEAFSEDGALRDPALTARAEALGARLATVTSKLGE